METSQCKWTVHQAKPTSLLLRLNGVHGHSSESDVAFVFAWYGRTITDFKIPGEKFAAVVQISCQKVLFAVR